jgi:DNA-binding transcriptional LysR family regulator
MKEVDGFNAFGAFMHVAESGSFTAAARRLGISTSAVGKAASRLEHKLSVRLFHRNARSVALTQEGELLLQSCMRIVSEMDAVQQMLRSAKGTPAGRLRLSLPMLPALLVPALNKFAQAYPAIELDLVFSDHLVDLIDDGFDVAVRIGEANDSRLVSRDLGVYRLVLVGSREYFLRAGKPQSVNDLRSHRCLHHRCATTGKLEPWPLISSAEAAHESVVPVTAVANTIEAMARLVECGFGMACLPDFAVRKQLAEGLVATVLDDGIVGSNVIRAVWPSSRHLAPKIRVFVDFMAQHLFAASD